LAGFEVTLIGRFWVTAVAHRKHVACTGLVDLVFRLFRGEFLRKRLVNTVWSS